jgi:uncharacterized protein YndB with AHSA1/START domain
MTNEARHEPDFRQATQAKKAPKAAVDGVAGMILAFGELSGTPEQAFRALTTDEILKWWKFPGIYHQKDWKADLRMLGAWNVTVELEGGGEVHANGEFCEIDFPGKLVMTRKFDSHPFWELGRRRSHIASILPLTARSSPCATRASSAVAKRHMGTRKFGKKCLDGSTLICRAHDDRF